MRTKIHLMAICAASALLLGLGGQEFRRERGGDNDAQKNAIEGKKPPSLTANEWLNTKPLKLAALKGKVVLLDFWAFW